jgi:hypothetical protein
MLTRKGYAYLGVEPPAPDADAPAGAEPAVA